MHGHPGVNLPGDGLKERHLAAPRDPFEPWALPKYTHRMRPMSEE